MGGHMVYNLDYIGKATVNGVKRPIYADTRLTGNIYVRFGEDVFVDMEKVSPDTYSREDEFIDV